jgi:hypothetical protein
VGSARAPAAAGPVALAPFPHPRAMLWCVCGVPLSSGKFLSPQPVLYGTGPMRPDRSAMPARPPNGPRPASQPCTGKGILSRKPPTQTRETRTDSRVVEDESPRRRFRRDDQVSPVPPPRPTRRPPRPPGWLATAGMQHTNKTPMPHSPGRHQGDDGDLKKTGFKPQRSKTLNDNR